LKNLYILLLLTFGFGQDYSLSFDGVDNYVEVPDNVALNPTSEISIAFNIYMSEYQNDETTLISKWKGDDRGYIVYFGDPNNDPGKFGFSVQPPGAQYGCFMEQSMLSLNTWHYVVAVVNNTSLQLYLDGTNVAQTITEYPGLGSSNEPLYFGAYESFSQHRFYNGKLDNLYIWNTALNQEEIQSYMATPPSGNEEGLVGSWKFNAGEGTTLYDHSSNGNHGTINGAEWVTNGTKHVAEDGSYETGNGSVDNPFGSIQYAIDMASDGDTVLVAAGTYVEGINLDAKAIALGSKFLTTGETSYISSTIIEGFMDFGEGEDSNTVVRGFTIQNSASNGSLDITNSSPTISDMVIQNCTEGGVLIEGSNVTLRNITVQNNSTSIDNGGGFRIISASNVTLKNCNILNNTVLNYNGGGIYVSDNSYVIISNSILSNNSTSLDGGGIFVSNSNLNLNKVTISNNTSTNHSGGGIYVTSLSTVDINNSIISFNTAITGTGIWSTNLENIVNIEYSDFYNIDANNLEDECTNCSEQLLVNNNILLNPQFTDPDNGDYSLQETSPCIDAGDPEILDPDGSRSDMGAYYFPQESNTLNIDEGANLMSFSVLPRNGLDDLPNDISGIIGAGVAANNLPPWMGSLQELSCNDGYWIINSGSAFEWDYFGIPCSDSLIYNLNEGANLISYSNDECGSLSDVLPDEVEDCLSGIIGQGVASNNMPPWAGSLNQLCPNEGYWFKSNCEIDFQYDEPTTLARLETPKTSQYAYNQSTQQAFYFIESIENIEQGDIIHTYSNDINVGSRVWNGSFTDVPAMGDDGSKFTAGYCTAGSIPTFKVEKANGSLITLTGDIPEWSNNQLYMVGYLEESIALPESFSLDRAYPNPFNPTTTLSFAIPVDSEVSISVYNLQGREVSTLIDANMDAGYHSVIWNADSYSSGVYFVKMVAGDFVNTQKLMLVK